MALTTRTLPSIANGISKQPAILRSFDQTEDELNTWGRLAQGLGRRPPTEHIAFLGNDLALDTAHVHHINRDTNERYVVIIDNGVIRVFDHETGTEKTVNAPEGLGYLDTDGSNYRATTVADYTFIVNTTKTPALLDVGADQTAQSSNYRWLGGSYANRVGGYVLPGSAYQFPPNPTYGSGLTGTVQSFDKLPDPPTGLYKVLGDTDTSFVSYYVMADGDVWDETVAPGLKNALDATTLPHALIREGDGTFTFAPFSWKPRRVGDAESNPDPLFVGRKINDVFFYQNRLGFLVGDSVVFSGAGEYGDFWRRTILDYIDSDTVSVAASGTEVATLEYAVPFADGIVLFSGQEQFVLSNGDAGLTPGSVSIQLVTHYLLAKNVAPAALGDFAYFASDAQGYVALQEYTKLVDGNSTTAAEVTAHVPNLIPRGVSQVLAAQDAQAVFVLTHGATTENRKSMYAYQFFWNRDSKLQSAWRRWQFEGEPVSGAYFDGGLSMLVKRADGYFLERMVMAPGYTSAYQNHLIYLDQFYTVAGVYNSGTNTTSFTLPYTPNPDTFRLVRSAEASVPESIIDPSHYTIVGKVVTVPGNEAHRVSAGHTYLTSTTISQQFPTDWQGHPLTTGRLQIHTFTVTYTDSAYFRARVNPYGDAAAASVGENVQVFTGRLLGTAQLVLGQPSYNTDSFTFSVAGNSKVTKITLENDSPFNSTFVSAEWEGLFFSRAQ